ncbi:MAG TPA: CoA pyrophosphatase [Dehalococcoidia bacterium]|nr:CoA pyrophosphatase [Dehalococcoidia bacterium]
MPLVELILGGQEIFRRPRARFNWLIDRLCGPVDDAQRVNIVAFDNRTEVSLKEELRSALQSYQPGRMDRPDAIPAAALLLLYERDDGVHVLFQERSYQVEHHKGEISFPGGARDEKDGSAAGTALRETYEEVGVAPDDVDLLGELDEIWTISNFRLRTFVGWLQDWPYPFQLQQSEVAALLEVPLGYLAEPGNQVEDVREINGRCVVLPSYYWEEKRIWGATARIVTNFLDVYRTLER